MSAKNRKSSTTRFLIGSFSILLFISAIAFFTLGQYMSKVSKKTIDEVGNLYMTGINEEISSHFKTLVDLKLEQAETAVKVVPLDDMNSINKLYEELIYRVSARNFDYVALCSKDCTLEMLYGEQIELVDPDPFFESLRNKENKVAVGRDEAGNELVVFGVAAKYPIKTGGRSIALVVALPIDYISTMLSGEDDNELIFSHIIRRDGSFIASDLSSEYKDYFSSLRERYDSDDPKEIEEYIKELSNAMEKKEDYSAILNFAGSRQQVYCTSLPSSEWNLVTILPFGNLNKAVEDLGVKRSVAMMSIFMIILAALLCIFYIYFRMSCQQLKELEISRQEALHANQAKSEFLSNMSHDIRTPMNAIVGMTAIAVMHIDEKDQVRNCLKKITLSSKHLLGLINDVLDMSKIESGKMTLTFELVSLREVVEGVVSIVQPQIKSKEQNFNVHIDNLMVEDVYCDSVRLNQVLLNLLSNSVKYTQEGGTIQLYLYEEDTSPSKGDDYVRLHVKVKDNGIGMTEEFLSHIFDSYSRADSKRVQKTEGAGLGMAITKYIVDAMGGTINVNSEMQKGTEFHLILDLEKANEKEIDMILPPWKMLVIDDDEMLCRTAVDLLETIGIQSDWTMSGEKAIDMIKAHHQKRDDYQIILLDWKLPDMDGLLVAKQIRRIVGADMPVILISAYDWSDFEADARAAGISGFIAKPLFKSTLFHELKKYMCVDENTDNEEKDMDLSGCHLLVAEDNEINWEVLKELLSNVGMELDWAENGQICLDKFKEAESGHYDAILMDVRMPVMNGYEATEAIRALKHPDAQNIPIIAMTADAFAEDIQRCLESGMNAHTAKPVNMNELISMLKKYIL